MTSRARPNKRPVAGWEQARGLNGERMIAVDRPIHQPDRQARVYFPHSDYVNNRPHSRCTSLPKGFGVAAPNQQHRCSFWIERIPRLANNASNIL
jgi:hypothetical protein